MKNMIKNLFTISIAAGLFLAACQEAPTQGSTDTTTTELVENNDDIVTNTSTDSAGNKLELTFNNTKGTVTLNFNGETSELAAQKPASGIWYKNDEYELRGKGNDLELKKGGNVVFTHTDEVVTKSLKNKEGDTLDMTFNNSTNEAKVYLNGGEQIDLIGQKPASGIWYKNDHYELRGKGDNVELTKDGKTVFKN